MDPKTKFGKLFQVDKKAKRTFFKGPGELIAKIPERYSNYGYLDVSDVVQTVGIFTLEYKGETFGYDLPATIVMEPSIVDYVNEEDGRYLKLTFLEGDVFIKYHEVLKDPKLSYLMFNEFVSAGRYPKFYEYMETPKMFDNIVNLTGLDFHTDMVVFEIIFSHLFRDPDNISTPYRLTDMKKTPVMIPLGDAAHASISTTGRIVGSYMDDGLISSIVNPPDTNSKLEDMMRM